MKMSNLLGLQRQKRRWFSMAVFLFCAAIMGCSALLPVVTTVFTVAADQTLPGSIVPLPMVGLPLVPGLFCNLPDEAALEQAVRDALGPFLSSMITVESAELSALMLDVAEESPDNFASITSIELTLYLLNAEDLRLESIPLGSAEAPEGFGRAVELAVEPPVDIVDLLRENADCAAVAVAVSGLTPKEDVVFDLRARVRIHAAIDL